MLQQLLHFTAPEKKLSEIDSLKYAIHIIGNKLDSLQVVVNKTEIGAGFFSDIISQNLYTYAVIIGLLALFSWGFVSTVLIIHKQKVDKSTQELLNEAILPLKSEVSKLADDQLRILYDTQRAMYFDTVANDFHDLTAKWCLDISKTLFKIDPVHEKITGWLSTSLHYVNLSQLGEFKDNIDEIEDSLRLLGKSVDTEVLVVNKKLLEAFRHNAYTKQTPPEDLNSRPQDNR